LGTPDLSAAASRYSIPGSAVAGPGTSERAGVYGAADRDQVLGHLEFELQVDISRRIRPSNPGAAALVPNLGATNPSALFGVA